jgi:cytolysin (calcineurin-like family phosphatase)
VVARGRMADVAGSGGEQRGGRGHDRIHHQLPLARQDADAQDRAGQVGSAFEHFGTAQLESSDVDQGAGTGEAQGEQREQALASRQDLGVLVGRQQGDGLVNTAGGDVVERRKLQGESRPDCPESCGKFIATTAFTSRSNV